MVKMSNRRSGIVTVLCIALMVLARPAQARHCPTCPDLTTACQSICDVTSHAEFLEALNCYEESNQRNAADNGCEG